MKFQAQCRTFLLSPLLCYESIKPSLLKHTFHGIQNSYQTLLLFLMGITGSFLMSKVFYSYDVLKHLKCFVQLCIHFVPSSLFIQHIYTVTSLVIPFITSIFFHSCFVLRYRPKYFYYLLPFFHITISCLPGFYQNFIIKYHDFQVSERICLNTFLYFLSSVSNIYFNIIMQKYNHNIRKYTKNKASNMHQTIQILSFYHLLNSDQITKKGILSDRQNPFISSPEQGN